MQLNLINFNQHTRNRNSIAQARVQPEMLHVNEHNVNIHMQQNL
jgi:hypothetical protein